MSGVRGKLYIVGVGPGSPDIRTIACIKAIRSASIVIGYKKYIDYVQDLIRDKKVLKFGMRSEVERVLIAIDYALRGEKVALVSGGDPQVYGMAGLVFEVALKKRIDLSKIDIEVIPGVTAALAAGARLGAPLASDFAIVNLSDLLVDRSEIMKRVEHAAQADFVIVFYNPVKKDLVEEAMNMVARYRSGSTPVGIAKNVYREGEYVVVTSLGNWKNYIDIIDMSTTIVVGSSRTYVYDKYMLTLRGYRV